MTIQKMYSTIRISVAALCLAGTLLALNGCSLDPANLNSATEDQALSTRDGIFATTVGLQRFYAVDVLPSIVTSTGVTSRELAVRRSFVNLVEIELGGAGLNNANANVLGLFTNLLRTIEISNLIINSAPRVTTIVDSTRNGILAVAYLHRAMALGNLIQNFEQAPIGTDRAERATYGNRTAVLNLAIQSLDSALLRLNATPGTLLPNSEFRNRVLPSGTAVDLRNVINAHRARYLLYAGRFQDAIAAADLVPLNSRSDFVYDGSNAINQLWASVFNAANASATGTNFGARDSLGLPAALYEAADSLRYRFFLGTTLVRPAGVGEAGFPGSIASPTPTAPPQFFHRNVLAFYTANNVSIPIYRPAEMTLIRAEAFVGLNRPADAVAEINRVRTKVGVTYAINTGANSTPYTGAQDAASLRTEIYKQRCIELFMTGTRLEDARRLGIPGPTPGQVVPPTVRNRNFYPYPERERTNNPNTPPDPTI